MQKRSMSDARADNREIGDYQQRQFASAPMSVGKPNATY
jgi:hypothetical protein